MGPLGGRAWARAGHPGDALPEHNAAAGAGDPIPRLEAQEARRRVVSGMGSQKITQAMGYW